MKSPSREAFCSSTGRGRTRFAMAKADSRLSLLMYGQIPDRVRDRRSVSLSIDSFALRHRLAVSREAAGDRRRFRPGDAPGWRAAGENSGGTPFLSGRRPYPGNRDRGLVRAGKGGGGSAHQSGGTPTRRDLRQVGRSCRSYAWISTSSRSRASPYLPICDSRGRGNTTSPAAPTAFTWGRRNP